MINWGYVAGFLDGEGCINSGHNSVALYQSDPAPLHKIADFLHSQGVKCSVQIRKTPRVTNFLVINQEAVLRANGMGATMKLLSGVLPYLQTKKRTVAQDYLRFRKMYPPMTLAQVSKLGTEAKARNQYHRTRQT